MIGGLALAGAPASAQLLGGARLPSLPALPLAPVTQALPGLERDLSPGALLDARLARLEAFRAAHRATVDRDERGEPVVRGEILALAPSPESLAAAERAGFSVLRREPLDALGLQVAALATPRGLSAIAALKRLRAVDPTGSYDYDHLYFGAGATKAPTGVRGEPASPAPSRARVGVIDTGAETRNPAFAGARVEQRGFAAGGAVPRPHGTATASLIAADQPEFRGGAPDAALWLADVYGTGADGGSALDIARALAWMGEVKAPVVSVSLVGPANRLLEASITALASRGVLVVAAVGDDGPAAPPMYPASYPQVVAVAAVDGRGRPLLENGRASHVDFCAPGADMAAAVGVSGYAVVRGSSFAAPLVAALLAARLETPEPRLAQAAVRRLAAQAVAHGAACGRGLVAADLRAAPARLHARPWPED